MIYDFTVNAQCVLLRREGKTPVGVVVSGDGQRLVISRMDGFKPIGEVCYSTTAGPLPICVEWSRASE